MCFPKLLTQTTGSTYSHSIVFLAVSHALASEYVRQVIVSFAIGCGIALLCLVLPFPRFALPMAHHRVAYAAALNAQVLCDHAFYPVYCLLIDIHKCVLGVRYDVF